jgi:RNA polymerase sigma-70 factor (ECF subfamily)
MERLLKERPRFDVELDEDDQSLAARAKSDREAFGLLYDRYLNRVYGYCRRRLPTAEGAEDATSLVFMRALTAIARYRTDGASFAAWLFTIAHNIVIDQSKQAARGKRFEWSPEVDVSRGPEESAVAAEAAAELHAMLKNLPPDQADVVHLRLAGLNDKEIAVVLGRSHGAIRIAQHRAIKRLRSLYDVEESGSGHE